MRSLWPCAGTARAHPARRIAALLAVAALCAGVAALPASSIPEKKIEERLKQQERNLKQAQEQAKQLGTQIGQTKAELQRIRDKVNSLRGLVLVSEAEYDKLVRELEEIQAEQETTREEMTDVKGDMERRARSAFIAGPAGGLELILGAESFQDVAERSTFLNSLQAQDADTADMIQDVAAQLHDLAVDQRTKAREAALALRNLERQREDLKQEAENEAAKVDELNKQLHEANLLVKKWGVKVEKTADKLGYAVGGNGPLYSCPVPDYNYIANGFGDPRVGHTHQGNDIPGPMGSDVVAPFDGVAKDSTNSLGGLSVSVYGKDGYVYMAHNSSIVKTGRVDAGDVVARVGMTGNAQGTLPHVHFEWHPGGGSAVDPYPYLMEVCRR